MQTQTIERTDTDERVDDGTAATVAAWHARVRAKLPSGAELLFCQHHANKHAPKLTELAAVLEVSCD